MSVWERPLLARLALLRAKAALELQREMIELRLEWLEELEAGLIDAAPGPSRPARRPAAASGPAAEPQTRRQLVQELLSESYERGDPRPPSLAQLNAALANRGFKPLESQTKLGIEYRRWLDECELT